MLRTAVIALVAAAGAFAPVFAFDGSITQLEPLVVAPFQGNTSPCPPMYYAAPYPINSSGMGMITQGNCLGKCDPGKGDSLFYWKEFSNGFWTKPAASTGAMPSFKETVNENPKVPNDCPATNQLANFKGAFGDPAVVRIGSKVFMAYLKGNGDWWTGEMWWAVSSDDGVTWSTQTQPLLYPLVHRGHQAHNCGEGFTRLSLTTTTDASGTWFHAYGTYFHPAREIQPGLLSFVDYRFKYDAANAFGLGNPKQIWANNQWVNSSGKLVWTYDTSTPPEPGDVKLDPSAVQASWGGNFFFTQSVTRGPNGVYYMLVDDWAISGDPLTLRTSCDGTNWNSTPLQIDTAMVWNNYPGKTVVQAALYYGTRFNNATQTVQTGFWAILSLGSWCSSNPYDGSRILPAKVTMTNTPTC